MRKEESLKPLISGKQREEVGHADDNSISFRLKIITKQLIIYHRNVKRKKFLMLIFLQLIHSKYSPIKTKMISIL